jgi:hypothetical protein
MRHRNKGLRKLCECARRNWSKCPHSWYFNFKPHGGRAYQFSLDAELDTHVASNEEAEGIADRMRGEIRAGTFERAAVRRIREAEERKARETAEPTDHNGAHGENTHITVN